MSPRIVLACAAALLATPALSQAVVTQAVTTTPALNGIPVSNNDLLQMPGVVVTTTGYTAFASGPSSFGQPNPVLINGSAGGNTTAATDWPNLLLEVSADVPQYSVRFDLDLTGAAAGYNITGFDTFAGWSDLRASQFYNVFVSLVGDPSFFQVNSNLGGAFGNSFGATLNNVGSRVRVTDSLGGVIASGVDSIRFDFLGGGAQGHVSREIDLFGTAIVPEPASATLALFGAVSMLARRRRLA